jgi:excisionase family DNA binding protein
MLTPSEVAQLLKVSEDDVVATLASGDLKGKKIGTAWRISRSAVDEFLKG